MHNFWKKVGPKFFGMMWFIHNAVRVIWLKNGFLETQVDCMYPKQRSNKLEYRVGCLRLAILGVNALPSNMILLF